MSMPSECRYDQKAFFAELDERLFQAGYYSAVTEKICYSQEDPFTKPTNSQIAPDDYEKIYQETIQKYSYLVADIETAPATREGKPLFAKRIDFSINPAEEKQIPIFCIQSFKIVCPEISPKSLWIKDQKTHQLQQFPLKKG